MKKKFRIIECTFPNGNKTYVIEKKTFFGWRPLNNLMYVDNSIEHYDSFEVARYRLESSPCEYSEKVVFEK